MLFGAKVTAKTPFQIPQDGQVLHISSACLVETGKENDRTILYVSQGKDQKHALAILLKGKNEQASLDQFLQTEQATELLVTGPGAVDVTGYYEPTPSDDMDSDDEEGGAMTLENMKAAFKQQLSDKLGHAKEDDETDTDEDNDDEEGNEEADSDEEGPGRMIIEEAEEDSDDDSEGEDDSQEGDSQEGDSQEGESQEGESQEGEEENKPQVNEKKRPATTQLTKDAKKSKKQDSPTRPSPATTAAPAATGAGDASYLKSLKDYLTANGKTDLSTLGTKVKKPDGVALKLAAFMKANAATFKIEKNMASLVK